MNAQQKQESVAQLAELFSNAPAAFIVNYQGCTCEALTGLRRELTPTGAKFAVVKNTLAKLAIAETDAAGLDEQFAGPVAVVWAGEDPVTPAKVVTKFAKDQETFEIKAGVVEGKCVDVSEIQSLAALPTKDELIAKLLALMNAPATRLLQTMNAPASELVRLLEAWRAEIEKK